MKGPDDTIISPPEDSLESEELEKAAEEAAVAAERERMELEGAEDQEEREARLRRWAIEREQASSISIDEEPDDEEETEEDEEETTNMERLSEMVQERLRETFGSNPEEFENILEKWAENAKIALGVADYVTAKVADMLATNPEIFETITTIWKRIITIHKGGNTMSKDLKELSERAEKRVESLTKELADDKTSDDRKKEIRKELGEIDDLLKKICVQADAVRSPGFVGGLCPFYYGVVHLLNESGKAKWTGAGMIIKDAALAGLGVLAYLNRGRVMPSAEAPITNLPELPDIDLPDLDAA